MTTALENARNAHNRFLAQILELDLDYCLNRYGKAPCTASGAAGTECYNTYAQCQDKANFVNGTKTYRFCLRGQPLPAGILVRPYVESLSRTTPELDPLAGLSASVKCDVKLVDDTDNDSDLDPYVATRATPAQGTFWTRFLARNPFFFGRAARIKTGYFVPEGDYVEAGYVADGYVVAGSRLPVYNENTLAAERYIIDGIKGPGRSGDITVTLKDPLKLTDKAMIPPATNGKLASAITDVAVTIPLGSGEGAQYDEYGYPCWVRIKDEIIKIASRSTDTLNVSARAQFDTTAAAHSQDDAVQLCKVWESEPITDVIVDIETEAGIATADIATGEMAEEEARWLGGKYWITHCLSKPEKASDLLMELVQLANAFHWWDLDAQKIRFKVNMPETATTEYETIDDEAHIVKGSLNVETLENERLTRAAIYYRLANAAANRSEAKNYLSADVKIDANAEGANEYGDSREKTIFARWLGEANGAAASAFVSRMVAARRDAPKRISFLLDPKDGARRLGELVDLDTRGLAKADGTNEVTRVRIVRRTHKGRHIEISARTTKFRSRYAYIAPNGTPNHPTDETYAHVAVTATQLMGDGSDPYQII